MATDFYPLLLRATMSLEQNTSEARQVVYNRALQILVDQLCAMNPLPFSDAIHAEFVAFEDAIRRIEILNGETTDSIGHGQAMRLEALLSGEKRVLKALLNYIEHETATDEIRDDSPGQTGAQAGTTEAKEAETAVARTWIAVATGVVACILLSASAFRNVSSFWTLISGVIVSIVSYKMSWPPLSAFQPKNPLTGQPAKLVTVQVPAARNEGETSQRAGMYPVKKCPWWRPHRFAYVRHDDPPELAPEGTPPYWRGMVKGTLFIHRLLGSGAIGVFLAFIVALIAVDRGFPMQTSSSLWFVFSVVFTIILLKLRRPRLRRPTVGNVYSQCTRCGAKMVEFGGGPVDYAWFGIAATHVYLYEGAERPFTATPQDKKYMPPPNAEAMIVEPNGRVRYRLQPLPPPPQGPRF